MRKITLTLLLFSISIFNGTAAFAQNVEFSNPNLRVKLKSSLTDMKLEGTGSKGSGSVSVQRIIYNGNWVWKIGGFEIKTDKTLKFEGVNLHQGTTSFPNTVLLVGKNGQFDVVGVLPLEDYLVGVLASEMPLSWPIETLKAQAIAARSYSLVRIKERQKEHFDLESSVLDQVFVHIRSGVDDNALIEKAKVAVKETSGMVLISPLSNQVLKAYYHSNCGGKTQDSKAIWGTGPNTGTAIDTFCQTNPRSKWTLKVSAESLAKRLKAYFKAPTLPDLSSLMVNQAGVAGLKTLWGDKELKIPAQDMREVLGYDQLRSTNFEVKKQGEDYLFKGSGFGHGVGLCQWGAKSMGKSGSSSDQILRHYYPKAEIKFTSSLRMALQKNSGSKEPLMKSRDEANSQFTSFK